MKTLSEINKEFDERWGWYLQSIIGVTGDITSKDAKAIDFSKEIKQFISEVYKAGLQAMSEAVIKKAKEMKKPEVSGTYCGCDSECFASCNDSYNNGVDDVIELLGKHEKTI